MYLVDVKVVLLHILILSFWFQKKNSKPWGFLMGNASCTPQQAAVLTDRILNMLVTDMRPLSMVEDDGFTKMIHTLNPGYTLPVMLTFLHRNAKCLNKGSEREYECVCVCVCQCESLWVCASAKVCASANVCICECVRLQCSVVNKFWHSNKSRKIFWFVLFFIFYKLFIVLAAQLALYLKKKKVYIWQM